MRGVHPGAEARGIYSSLPDFLPLSHVYPTYILIQSFTTHTAYENHTSLVNSYTKPTQLQQHHK